MAEEKTTVERRWTCRNYTETKVDRPLLQIQKNFWLVLIGDKYEQRNLSRRDDSKLTGIWMN